MNLTPTHEKILSLFRSQYFDENHKISAKNLAFQVDLTPRSLRNYIEDLRSGGVPIGSSWTPGDNGYWLVTDPQKLAHWIADRKGWLNGQHKTLENMKKYYYEIGGQKNFLDKLIAEEGNN